MFDGQQLGEEVVALVRGFMEREIAPLKAKIAELEGREPIPGPPGEKGEKGDPGADGRDGKDGQDGRNGENGKDAAGIVEALKDSGELVLTLQDGRLIRTGIRDGEKGQDGRDGFSLDDFDVENGDDGRTFVLKFERGDVSHTYELTFPVPVYCGIYKEGTNYVPGDLATWGGELWHCDKETTGKPDCGDWTRAVRRGRDSKNG